MIDRTILCVLDALQIVKSKLKCFNKWVLLEDMHTDYSMLMNFKMQTEMKFNLYKLETHGVHMNGMVTGVINQTFGLTKLKRNYNTQTPTMEYSG